jgi:peptide-methionine (S)-S-oxide reductase
MTRFNWTAPLGLCLAAVLGVAVFALQPGRSSAEAPVAVPAPAIDETASTPTETAVFAGGCFWGVQGVFQHVEGVKNAVSGYAGGAKDKAEYEVVSGGGTGHAESVKVTYDPSKITYGRLLQIYFSVAHDPTQLNRQGPDHGTQYRSTIFPANDEQAKVAKAYIDQLDAANTFGRKLATTIEPGKAFYPAEAYHQDYLTLNPRQPYIVYNDLPKIEALKQMFPTLYRAKPVLVSEAGL